MKREVIEILLIEDNPGDVRLIREMLKEVSIIRCHLEHAPELSTGIETLRKKKFDIILLDLGLPDSMGLETLNRIHSAGNSIPVVIMTGQEDEELGVKAVQSGAQDYLLKSQINSALLIHSLRYAIERKRIEEKLRRSEANLAEAQRLAHLGSYMLDLLEDRNIWSQETYRILGWDMSKAVPTMEEYINQLVHPEDRENLIREIKTSTREKLFLDMEYRIITPDNKIKYIHSVGEPITNSEGVVTRIFGTIMDITARRESERALRESELRFRSTFDQAAVGIAHLSIDGHWLRVNRKLCDILGYSEEGMLGLTFRDLTYPDDLPEDLHLIDQLMAGEINTYSMEKRYLRKDGLSVWCQLTRSLVRDETGRPAYFISVVEDISRRKQIETALRDSEQRLSTIFRESPSAILISSFKDGKIQDVNDAFQNITGYSRQEVIGKETTELELFLSANDRRKLTRDVEKYGEVRNLEMNFRLKSGQISTGLVSATRINVEGETSLLTVVLDISERKKAAEQIQSYVEELQKNQLELENNAKELSGLNQKLKELNASKDKFFSIVAHDLRSPFSALLGFSEYMYKHIEELEPEEVRDFSYRIYKSLNSLLKLIENLLQWSRIHTGKMEFSPVTFSFNYLIDEILNIYLVNAKRKEIEIKCRLDRNYSVYADKDMVDSIIRNLMSNAIKFTMPGGSITVSVRSQDKFLEIEVADTGIGIEKEDLERMFRIDENLTREGTDREKGTGLGLVLCKEFVEMNGGRIWVESQAGKGSRFIFTLPNAEDQPPVSG